MIERLVHALQALAVPAEEQLARYPVFVVKADELALDYADALLLITDCPQVSLTPEQQAALEDVDQLLDWMSGEKNAALWTEAALRTAPDWQQVRRLAREDCWRSASRSISRRRVMLSTFAVALFDWLAAWLEALGGK
jgi:hypothetical protein